MRGRVITVQRDESVDRAQTLMALHNIRHLPVLDGQRLVGVISDRDVLGIMVQQRRCACGSRAGKAYFLPPGVRVEEAMTADPVVVAPGADIEAAARLLIARKIGCLPVVDRDRVVGIITETDILSAFVEVMGIQAEQTRLELVLEERAGAFLDACRIVQDQGGDIVSVVTATASHRGEPKKVMLFRLEGVALDPLVKRLEASGHTVLSAIA